MDDYTEEEGERIIILEGIVQSLYEGFQIVESKIPSHFLGTIPQVMKALYKSAGVRSDIGDYVDIQITMEEDE